MNEKFTKGPLHVGDYAPEKAIAKYEGEKIMITIKDKKGSLIGRAFGFRTNKQKAEANAVLFSAAPDLYYSGEKVVRELMAFAVDKRLSDRLRAKVIAIIEKSGLIEAIKKANP